MAQRQLIGLHPSPDSASARGPDDIVDQGYNNVPQLFGGMGNINMTTDRSQEASVPWSGPMQPMQRKLTHFRAPGMGDPLWSGHCIYDIPGVSESISEYDDPDFYAYDSVPNSRVQGGVITADDRLAISEVTTSRRARVAAHFDSAPAARHFQGYWNPHWSGLLAGFVKATPRPLFQNFNPNQKGSKELHQATQYTPYPAMGSILPYFGTTNPKAL